MDRMTVVLRDALPADLEALLSIWYDGWQDAHASIVPVGLRRLRTKANLRERLPAMLPRMRVAEVDGRPVGFCVLKGEELDQLYVDERVRGAGVAAALIADAEARLRAAGVRVAWLACAIGNHRAARFYEKSGWVRAREETIQLETPAWLLPLEIWRYEKELASG